MIWGSFWEDFEMIVGAILELVRHKFDINSKLHAFIFGHMFYIGFLTLEPMAILFFISVGLGLVARTVPQMNVFIVGFPLQIGVGLFMVGLSMSFFSIVVQGQIEQLPERFLGIMQSFKS